MKTWATTDASRSGPGLSEQLAPGSMAGPWRVEHLLGSGGMGAVYAVVHDKIGKRAALKVLHRHLLGPGFNAERMLLEARVVNEVAHPNIVDIFDTGTLDDGRPYIVMERLTGETLAERAARHLAPVEALAILRQISDALIAAHAAGVVHRDLKLDNLFVIDGDRIKILDWGIARIIHHDARHTTDGQLIGTPAYLAPEQARGGQVTTQTDVYSLGVVAYELLLGRLPFEARSATEVMAMHLLMPPPPPRTLWHGIRPQLEALLLAMLAKTPEERPTMREVARQLDIARHELEQRSSLDDAPVALRLHPDLGSAPDLETVELVRRTARRWPLVVGVLSVPAFATLAILAYRADRASDRASDDFRRPTTASAVARPVPRKPATIAAPPTAPPTPLAVANPVLESCADPDVLRTADRWVMTCTGGAEGNRYPIYTSPDLAHWQRASWIFPHTTQPAWANGNYWAPELHPIPGGYAAYFSMRAGTVNAIGVATASSVLGPYLDRGAPLLAPAHGASDAHVLIDRDGARYLYYKLAGEPSSIWVHRLTADGLALAEGPSTKLLTATEPWEHGIVEAPWVHREGAWYYLFYSGARYCDAGYAVGVARAASPLGPFEKLARPILATGTQWAGPGHVAITTAPDGGLAIAYHAYELREGTPSCTSEDVDANHLRDVRIDRLAFERGWPRVLTAL